MRQLLLVCISISILISCTKETDSNPPLGSDSQINDWYPIELGFWAEYKIDTINYLKSPNDSSAIVTNLLSYYREEIVDKLSDTDTPYQYRILTKTKKNISDPWNFSRYYSIIPYSSFILKNEDNIKFVKLQMPILNSTVWKGNRYIDSSSTQIFHDWSYSYSNKNMPYSVGNLAFDSTLTVIQIADSNAIEKKYAIEVYAKHIGLIYSELAILEKQNGANPWTMPENGFIIRKSIINWKK